MAWCLTEQKKNTERCYKKKRNPRHSQGRPGGRGEGKGETVGVRVGIGPEGDAGGVPLRDAADWGGGPEGQGRGLS